MPVTSIVQGLLKQVDSQLPSFENEPSWLTDYRRQALSVYRSSRAEPNPLYKKYAALSKFEDSGLVLSPYAVKVEKIPSAFGDLRDDSIFSLQAGAALYTEWGELPKGMIVEDIATAAHAHGPKLKEYFAAKGLQPSDDIFVALGSAMMNGGTFIYVPKNTSVGKPVHSVFIDNEPGMAHFHQNIIYVEEGSSVDVLSEVRSSSDFESPTLFGEVTDIFAHPGSQVHYTSLQNLSRKSVYLTSKRALCDRDSTVHWVSSFTGAEVTRARADTRFIGAGASTDDYEILFGNGTQRFDVVTDLHHNVANTSGRITVRSVLRDKSRSLLRGMIRIGEEGANTSSYLAEHGMLLSKDAKCDAIPGLEILTNGVKATHSASVSQMDAEHLYYLQTRGLSKDEAEKLMVLGFFDPVISRIQSESVRDKLRFLIEDKWNNVFSLQSARHLDELEFEKYVKDQIKTTENIFEGHYKYR